MSLLLIFGFLMTSCSILEGKKNENDLNYMKNIEGTALQSAQPNAAINTIQTGDQLIISVSAPDMKVAAPFNQNYYSSELIQPNAPGGNTPTQGQTTLTGPMYIVDAAGNINFPFLGIINTTGKNISSLRDELTQKITKYIINPTVNVRLANFRVTILGEVNRQGEYTMPNGQATLLSALGLAGDLSMYGKRDDIMVIRTVDGVITQEKINLTDANFINSPFFNLKQGDVIYVPATKTKDIVSKQNPNLPLYISAVGTIVTILALIIRTKP